MAEKINMEEIEKEVRELIMNSKSKRTTILEPCNDANISECLKSIHEEMSLHGIRFRFDPEVYMEGSEDTVQTLVRLINSTWNLLMQHKEIASNADKLKERNYALQQNNFHLNNLVEQLKKDMTDQENKSKQFEEGKRQAVHKLDTCQKDLSKATEEAKKYKKQLASKEDQLTKQVKKMEKEYSILQEKVRGKFGVFTSRNEASKLYGEEFKAREKKYKETIAKLQDRNRKLLLEVVNLKDDVLGSGSEEFE